MVGAGEWCDECAPLAGLDGAELDELVVSGGVAKASPKRHLVGAGGSGDVDGEGRCGGWQGDAAEWFRGPEPCHEVAQWTVAEVVAEPEEEGGGIGIEAEGLEGTRRGAGAGWGGGEAQGGGSERCAGFGAEGRIGSRAGEAEVGAAGGDGPEAHSGLESRALFEGCGGGFGVAGCEGSDGESEGEEESEASRVAGASCDLEHSEEGWRGGSVGGNTGEEAGDEWVEAEEEGGRGGGKDGGGGEEERVGGDATGRRRCEDGAALAQFPEEKGGDCCEGEVKVVSLEEWWARARLLATSSDGRSTCGCE